MDDSKSGEASAEPRLKNYSYTSTERQSGFASIPHKGLSWKGEYGRLSSKSKYGQFTSFLEKNKDAIAPALTCDPSSNIALIHGKGHASWEVKQLSRGTRTSPARRDSERMFGETIEKSTSQKMKRITRHEMKKILASRYAMRVSRYHHSKSCHDRSNA